MCPAGARAIFGMSNPLNGATLFRYTHIYRHRTSGGMEQYLRQLNSGLLRKHRLRILQTHLVDGSADATAVEVEPCGLGEIVWLPVPLLHFPRSLQSLPARWNALSRDSNASRAGSVSSRVWAHRGRHLTQPDMILSDHLPGLLDQYRVDLLLFHWLSYDAAFLARSAQRRAIPYCVINHFDNRRWTRPSYRRVALGAAGLASVSNAGIPPTLAGRHYNLSDAVDTAFFSLHNARPLARPPGFVVLLPSRIAEGKGHLDLVMAAIELKRQNVDATWVFAGVAEKEASGLLQKLKALIGSSDLTDRFLFLGQLNSAELRDWYGASDLVVLPSHSEGLGRVLLEAQAMSKPVLAYSVGGMPEALIDGESGWLVNCGDHRAMAEKIRLLIADPTRGAAMGEAGRNFVLRKFSVDALVERHESFCLDLINRG